MKKSLLCTLLIYGLTILLSKQGFAQGNNLSFDQAIFLEFSAPGDGNSTLNICLTQTLTVPANKILKITSVYSTATQSSWNGTVGGNQNFLSINYCSGPNVATGGGELFLPAGTYTVRLSDGGQASYTTIYGFISGIQYNIVP